MRPLARVPVLMLALGLAACADGAQVGPEAAGPAPPETPAAVPESPSTPAVTVPADTLTVVFFGDSLTEGYGLPGRKDEAYPALIQARADSAGLAVRVVNAGVSGHTSADGRGRIDWTLRQSTPDVFVLALGANDMLRGLSPEAMRENLAAILARVRQANPDVRLVVAGLEGLPNLGGDYTTRFRQVFPALAEAYDAALVPFLLEGVAGVVALNQPDYLHPTAAGQRIIAGTVWRVLEPVLREAAAEGRTA